MVEEEPPGFAVGGNGGGTLLSLALVGLGTALPFLVGL